MDASSASADAILPDAMVHLRSIELFASLATLACLTAACAAPSKATGDGADPAFLFPRAGRATLIVMRGPSVADDGCTYAVAIDANVAGQLAPSGWITLYPPAGTHVVSLQPSGRACPRNVEIRTRLEAERSQRLQIVRTTTGALQWKTD
jgi:hypothetical protein